MTAVLISVPSIFPLVVHAPAMREQKRTHRDPQHFRQDYDLNVFYNPSS